MNVPPRSITAALATGLLLAACGGSGDARAAAIVFDTLPDGTVHVRNPETGVWGPGEVWSLVEDLRIGALEGEGPESFGQIRGLEVDDRGRIYVVDAQAHAVQLFGPDGGHLRTLGREGAGPGELRQPWGARLAADGKLWVVDTNGRYNVFGPEGEFEATHPRPVTGFGWSWDGGFSDGRLLEFTSRGLAGGNELQPVIVRLDEELAAGDTVELPRHEERYLEASAGGNRMLMAVPYAPVAQRLLDAQGMLWTGYPERYRIEERRPDGRLLRLVERIWTPVRVTPEEKAEALSTDGFRRFREMGGRVDASDLPDRKSAYEYFFTDDRRHLWVQTPIPAGEDGTRFDLFDEERRYLGELRSPMRLLGSPRPIVRGDHLYGVVTGELDIPYVVRWTIQRGP